MFVSLEFSRLGFQFAMHARWTPGTHEGSLWIGTMQEANTKIRTLDPDEWDGFRKCADALWSDPGVDAIEFEGAVAQTLARFLVTLHRFGAPPDLADRGVLLGFWEPPAGPLGSGIIVRQGSSLGRVVHIVHSKNAARAVIGSMRRTLGDARFTRLQERIRNWNCARRSSRVPRYIKGPIAELLCVASVAEKMFGALNRIA